jgi:hypothetical protein
VRVLTLADAGTVAAACADIVTRRAVAAMTLTVPNQWFIPTNDRENQGRLPICEPALKIRWLSLFWPGVRR